MLKEMMVAGGLLFGLNGMGESMPQVIAHRGGSDEQDENTLAGIKGSFEPRALQKIKELKADQQTCLVADEAGAKVLKTALELRAEGVSAQLNNLSRAFVRDAHKAGLKVTTWTIKNSDDAQLALALGVDFVASDIPAAQLAQKSARP